MTDDIKRPKRPRDANQLAKSIVDIAIGEQTDDVDMKSPRHVFAGAKGGANRAISMSKTERSEVARKAAKARWINSPERAEED